MSQAILENVDVTGPYIGTGRGDHQYPPQSVPAQEPRGISNFVDGSGPIFSMYLEMATEEDKKKVEGWKADADGILIFTGLFSAAVASLISVSIQDIRPNPQDTSNFYLANIYQATLAGPGSNISSSLPTSPLPFTPPNYAVWVNTLLFLSLVISISCALLATLLQQWARRYLKVTQPRYSPHKRARIRAFFSEGIDKFLLPWAVEALPTLLHVSLFLFFAGISVFLWNVNHTIFTSVVSWIGICTALYGCITFVPIFRHDSPYHTPLSLPAWHIVAGASWLTFRALRRLALLVRFSEETYRGFGSLEEKYYKPLVQGMQKSAEETALDSSSDIDTRAFMWTFDSLDEDHELERFFSGLPGFRSSKVIDDPLPRLTEEQLKKLSTALTGLFTRTFSSDLLPSSVKNWRAIICARALDPTWFSNEYYQVMNSIMFENKFRGLQTSKFGCTVRGWDDGRNQRTALVTKAIVTNIITAVEGRDDWWFNLASSALGVTETVLRDYATDGDSLSLAILIHIVRQQFAHSWESFWPSFKFANVLNEASRFDVQDTSLELRHDFCALWNQIVLKVQNDNDRWMVSWILEPIRNIYISLHQDTNSAATDNWDNILDEPSSYPVCNVAGHIHGSAPTTFVRTVLHDNTVLVPVSLASPDYLSSSMPHPLRVVDSLDVPPLGDGTHVSRLIHPAHQIAIKDPRIHATSPDLVSTQVIQGAVDSTATMPPSTPGALTPTPPTLNASTFPTCAVHAERRTSLDDPDLPSSPSPTPILDVIPLAEFHSPIPGTPRPWLSSTPDLGVAAEGDGSAEAAPNKEKDAIYPPSAIRENTMSTPELPSQSPSPPPVTDVAIAGPSLRSLDVENTGEGPPHASHGQYDIV